MIEMQSTLHHIRENEKRLGISQSTIAPAGNERFYQQGAIKLGDTIAQAKQKLTQTKCREVSYGF